MTTYRYVTPAEALATIQERVREASQRLETDPWSAFHELNVCQGLLATWTHHAGSGEVGR